MNDLNLYPKKNKVNLVEWGTFVFQTIERNCRVTFSIFLTTFQNFSLRIFNPHLYKYKGTVISCVFAVTLNSPFLFQIRFVLHQNIRVKVVFDIRFVSYNRLNRL